MDDKRSRWGAKKRARTKAEERSCCYLRAAVWSLGTTQLRIVSRYLECLRHREKKFKLCIFPRIPVVELIYFLSVSRVEQKLFYQS